MANIIEGIILDVYEKILFKGKITFDDKILSIEKCDTKENVVIIPPLVDAHVHVESSMITPQFFAQEAVKHGVVAVVNDPHEIANVCGVKGFNFMLNDAKKSNFKFYFGVPSCVPATELDKSGAEFNANVVEKLLNEDKVVCLSEMMNFVGVINEDNEVMKKIDAAKSLGKAIDGHAPDLNPEHIKKYAQTGISTDHECSNIEEALMKIDCGQFIQIREGSAAKNQNNLKSLFKSHPDRIMICSDDIHPDDLSKEYLLERIKKLTAEGFDVFDLFKAGCVNPVKHYKLDVGTLRVGECADFLVVDNLKDFKLLKTFINGITVFEDGKSLINPDNLLEINNFNAKKINVKDIQIKAENKKINVIEAVDGELITNALVCNAKIKDEKFVSDVKNDFLKVVVMSRYDRKLKPAVGFIKGFGLKFGAICSSIAHDSHNIICVGVDDESIVKAVNKVVENKGGIAVATLENVFDLKLEVAGLMKNAPCQEMAEAYGSMMVFAKLLGCKLKAPFMTLSFMSLLVIPDLKITANGLFHVKQFNFINLEYRE